MRSIIFLSLWLAFLLPFFDLMNVVSTDRSPINMIIDTDIGPYTDDFGAFSIVHTFADQGLVRIRAVVADNNYEGIVPVIEAMNRYFNRSIQIGTTKDPNAYDKVDTNQWIEYVISNHSHPTFERNSEAEDAVTLYRRLLSIAQDESITILSLGHFVNLANLLRSNSDQYSKLNGSELVRIKVKSLVAMCGTFPMGEEWNIIKDIKSAQYALHNWPTHSILVGSEIGDVLFCGKTLINNTNLTQSPMKTMFQMDFNQKRSLDKCYDQSAALISVKGHQPWFDLINGSIEIFDNGTNVWHETLLEKSSALSKMAYVKLIVANDTLVDAFNPLMER